MAVSIAQIFRPRPQPSSVSTALLLLRLVAGLAFAFHGWGKIQSPFNWMGPDAAVPGFFQFLAALSEFGGGIAWMAGAVVPLASAGIAVTMVVATLLHAVVMKDPFVATSKGGGSYELAAIYLLIALLLMTTGPGRYSLDAAIFGERK